MNNKYKLLLTSLVVIKYILHKCKIIKNIIYLETRFNASNRTPRPARFTLKEEQSCIFLQNSIRRTTCMAGNIFLNISENKTFFL